MDLERLSRDLKVAEGLRLTAYEDTRGIYTIGYGHAHVEPNAHWTSEQCEDALACDIQAAIEECDRHIPWWRHLNEPRQRAMVELMFNMGWGDGKHGLSTFKNTLRRIEAGQYMNAAAGLQNSAWAKQVGPRRSGRIIRQIRDGL